MIRKRPALGPEPRAGAFFAIMRQDQRMAARPGRLPFREKTMWNIAILAFALLMLGATIERSHAEEMPNLKDPAMISAGHALFLEKQCAHCHGEGGTGGVNLARRELDAKGVFVSIADGREKNGIRMPAWREVMSDQEIWQATAYVLSICKSQN